MPAYSWGRRMRSSLRPQADQRQVEHEQQHVADVAGWPSASRPGRTAVVEQQRPRRAGRSCWNAASMIAAVAVGREAERQQRHQRCPPPAALLAASGPATPSIAPVAELLGAGLASLPLGRHRTGRSGSPRRRPAARRTESRSPCRAATGARSATSPRGVMPGAARAGCSCQRSAQVRARPSEGLAHARTGRPRPRRRRCRRASSGRPKVKRALAGQRVDADQAERRGRGTGAAKPRTTRLRRARSATVVTSAAP